MKKLLLLLISLVSALPVLAQAWLPFQYNQPYVFKGMVNGEINNIALGAGWGYNLHPGWCDTAGYALHYGPYGPFGGAYNYGDSVTFHAKFTYSQPNIYPYTVLTLCRCSQAGDKRIFNGDTLTYLGKVQQTFLHGTDSAHIYKFLGQRIVWTKTAGIIEMPVLENPRPSQANNPRYPAADGLWGPKGNPLYAISVPGHQTRVLPNTNNLLPYQPGDSLQTYEVHNYLFNGNYYPNQETWTIHLVLSRDTLNGRVQLKTLSWSFRQNLGLDGSTPYAYYTSPTVSILYSIDAYPSPVITGTHTNFLYGGAQEIHSFISYLKDKVIGADTVLAATETGTYSSVSPSNFFSDSCVTPLVDGYQESVYVPGVGKVSSITQDGKWELKAYRIGGVGGIGAGSMALPTAIKAGQTLSYKLAKNPANEQLEVTAPSPLNLTLTDMQGRIVAENKDTRTLETSHLPAGMYLLKLADRQGRTGQLRVAVEH